MDDQVEAMIKKVVEITGKRPSMHYMQKSEDAETMLERSVYKNFASRFNAIQENAILAVGMLEYDRKELLQKAADAESEEQKQFFDRAAELYAKELSMIYKGVL